MEKLNRRSFLKSMAAVTGAAMLKYPKLSPIGALDDKVKVYRITSRDSFVDNKFDAEVITRMLRTGIKHLSSTDDFPTAVRNIFPSITLSDKISIKVNCVNSRVITRFEAGMSLANLLGEMEINGQKFPLDNIIVWDRATSELKNCGYQENKTGPGIKVYGTDGKFSSKNYDIYGSNQPVSQIISDQAKYLINFAVAKDSGIAGIALTMKNHYGSCKTPSALHGNTCGYYAPALNKVINDILPFGQNLFLLDAIVGIYSGGPQGTPQFADYSIYMSKDQAAIDAVGKKLLDDYRASRGQAPLNAPMVEIAAQPPFNLGTSDLNKIEVVQLAPDEPVAVLEKNLDSGIQLIPPSPNPFKANCSIILVLEHKSLVSVNIFDLQGKLVRQINSGVLEKGVNQFQWDGRDNQGNRVSPAQYFIKVSTGHGQITSAKVVAL